MREIEQTNSAVLRTESLPVEEGAFGTPEFAQDLLDMAEALDAQKDGVAIAAPQVGIGKRIFLVRYDRMVEKEDANARPNVGVYINPKILHVSKKKTDMPEGCLSVRGLYGTTNRHEKATVRAQNELGEWFERGAGGILAQAFQHEIDHLNGILFIDHAHDVYEQAPGEKSSSLEFHAKQEP